MRRAAAIAAALACLAVASAAQAHPTYQWCNRGGQHCTRAHRVYRIRCGGWLWLSPKPVFVPRAWRHDRRMRWWCEANVPAFPSRSGLPL